jgi:hypothetical protein
MGEIDQPFEEPTREFPSYVDIASFAVHLEIPPPVLAELAEIREMMESFCRSRMTAFWSDDVRIEIEVGVGSVSGKFKIGVRVTVISAFLIAAANTGEAVQKLKGFANDISAAVGIEFAYRSDCHDISKVSYSRNASPYLNSLQETVRCSRDLEQFSGNLPPIAANAERLLNILKIYDRNVRELSTYHPLGPMKTEGQRVLSALIHSVDSEKGLKVQDRDEIASEIMTIQEFLKRLR